MSPLHPLRRTLRWFRAAIATAAVGLGLLVVAVALAGARYAACGPSRFDAADPACRTGVVLLAVACSLLAAALVMGAASLSLLWRARRRLRTARRPP